MKHVKKYQSDLLKDDVGRNIEVCQVWKEFSKIGTKLDNPCYLNDVNHFLWEFRPFVRKVPQWVDRYCPFLTRSRFDKNNSIYQVWSKADTFFKSYRWHQPHRATYIDSKGPKMISCLWDSRSITVISPFSL